MADVMTRAQQIKRRYQERAKSAFPTADIKALLPGDRSAFSLLHGRDVLERRGWLCIEC